MSEELMVRRVLRNQAGDIVRQQDYATKLAVIVDEEANLSEIIKIDRVRIVGMLVNLVENVFQANFMIGGLDSTQAFHWSPRQLPALLAVNQSQDRGWWATHIEDRTIYDFTEVLRWIHEAGAVNVAGDNIWSMPDLESYYVGVPTLYSAPVIPGPAEFEPGVIPGQPVIPSTTGPLPDA
jgi:hypothetical protein